MRRALVALSLGLVLAGCSSSSPDPSASEPGPTSESNAPSETSTPEAPVAGDVPAGAYTLDAAHSSLAFGVSHLGFSNYTGEFDRFDARLQFDPRNPAASQVSVTIDPRSLDVSSPPEGFIETLQNEAWLGVAQFPEMTFRSTQVEVTGPNRVRIHGDLTLRGTTQPVTLDATFNGGYAGHPYEPNARIGFSARGTLQRSKFGMTDGIPAPGSTFGVSDEVEIVIEAEFTGPPLARGSKRQ